MKQTQKISAVIMMFLLIGVLLLTSFQVAIYGDSQYRFYKREYKKYQVADRSEYDDGQYYGCDRTDDGISDRKEGRSCQLLQMWMVKHRISSMNRTGFIWEK